MHIPRELNIHHCDNCKKNLVDSNFEYCGIFINGEKKRGVFFVYMCNHCKFDGSYYFPPVDGDLPGDIFRDMADALDSSYLSEINVQTEEIDGLLQDLQE